MLAPHITDPLQRRVLDLFACCPGRTHLALHFLTDLIPGESARDLVWACWALFEQGVLERTYRGVRDGRAEGPDCDDLMDVVPEYDDICPCARLPGTRTT